MKQVHCNRVAIVLTIASILIALCGCQEARKNDPQRKYHPIGFQWVEDHCNSDGTCIKVTFRVADFERDGAKTAMRDSDVLDHRLLYTVEYTTSRDPSPRAFSNACGPAGKGLFVDGSWSSDGTYRPDGFTFACLDGVIAKCIRTWGYDPTKTAIARGGSRVSLRALHLACIRAARADYCGNGQPNTRNGTQIIIGDPRGIGMRQARDTYQPEACFNRHGAIWVSRTRWSLGAKDQGDWLDLPNCRRPKLHIGPLDPNSVVCVWSNPSVGRYAAVETTIL